MFKPVNDRATVETRDLLSFFYSVKDKKTLSGQHNYIGENSIYTDQISKLTGKTPLVWGSDFGFSSGIDKDSIEFRSNLPAEAVRWHQKGAVVVISYHQGNPVIGEPCDFIGGVQSEFTDLMWKDLLTARSELYDKWIAMMDELALFLKKMEELRIPIVFRPYHEMNGDWFWWGGKPEFFKKLWIRTYEHFTEYHKLDNLIWAWCTDKPHEGIEEYYPGHQYVDVLGCDIYPEEGKEVYPQDYYDRMEKLAQGRIVALTENSIIPDDKTLEKQPWSWFMGWSELPAKEQSPDELRRLYCNPRLISLKH